LPIEQEIKDIISFFYGSGKKSLKNLLSVPVHFYYPVIPGKQED
jgi:hypothetical protein